MTFYERCKRLEKLNDKWRRHLSEVRKRLCAVPAGSTINLEDWYGPGWGTAEYLVRELATVAKPLFRIDRQPDHTEAMIATKLR